MQTHWRLSNYNDEYGMSIGFQLQSLDTNYVTISYLVLNLHFSMKDWVVWQNEMQWKQDFQGFKLNADDVISKNAVYSLFKALCISSQC